MTHIIPLTTVPQLPHARGFVQTPFTSGATALYDFPARYGFILVTAGKLWRYVREPCET